jgi:hypothetical protein
LAFCRRLDKTVGYFAATYWRLAWQLCGHGINPVHGDDPGNRLGPASRNARFTQGAFA